MEFYEMLCDEGTRKKFAYGIIIGKFPFKEIYCDECNKKWKKNMLLEKDEDIEIVLSNDNYADFLLVVSQNLISSNAKNILTNSNITGFTTEEIQALSICNLSKEKIKELRDDGYKVSKIPNNPPIYHRLFVDVGGEVHEISQIKLEEYCEDCGHKKYVTEGYTYINPSSPVVLNKSMWNGNNLFRVKQLGHSIFCTDKVLKIYKENNLTGLNFIKVDAL